jgi:hypothetical protein
MTVHDGLATALLQTVAAQHFEDTPDALAGGAAVQHFPSIDLAVADFSPGRAPRWANVLFSREHPSGVVAGIHPPTGSVSNIRFDADLQNAQHGSVAWLPGADWSVLPFQPLFGAGALRFVAPYPASLLKLMVAVGVGLAVDRGLCAWPSELGPMIVASDNEATNKMVALLHRCGMVDVLNQRFAALGLHTLQLHHTQAGGGWRNADGAGVGRIHMTAWDTVRLLWLLDAGAPPAPWWPAGEPLLQAATRERLLALLQAQELNEMLSSSSLMGVPGWVAGLPGRFAHKTGATDNYGSDAGIVNDGKRHYLIAALTNLGRRYAPHQRCATTWKLPALGAAIDRLLT